MSEAIQRKEIGKGVFFTKITDSRYKRNLISMNFLTDLSEESASVNAIVPRLLAKASADYPTLAALSNKLSSLYAARISGNAGKHGDSQFMLLSCSTIDDMYALEGEKLTDDVLDIMLGCLFRPLTENGIFSEKMTALEKQSLIDDIEAEINDKISYARSKGYKLMCSGEPAAVKGLGSTEKAAEITAESAFAAYKKMLETCHVEIICAGCNDFESAEKKLTDAFGKINRGEITVCRSDKSPLKAEVVTETEKMPVTQSKMVLGFKTSCTDYPALTVMSAIYGGTTTSKLFMNVREKMSLCYYCSSSLNRDKGIIIVNSGVENNNIEKAKAEILAQFEDMKKGNFTDEDISHARLSLENDLKGVNDSPKSVVGWYFSGIYRNDAKTPEESVRQINEVTRERIVQAAQSVELDCVYILTSDEEKEVEG